MTDTKIQRLRGISAWLDVAGWTNMAVNVREAADELERLGKIEAAAKDWRRSRGTIRCGITTLELDKLLEANPCPTK